MDHSKILNKLINSIYTIIVSGFTSYIVFWKEESGWWWALSLFLILLINVSNRDNK